MTIPYESELYFEPHYLKDYRTRFCQSENLALRFTRFVRFDLSKRDEPRLDRKWIRRMHGSIPASVCGRMQARQIALCERLTAAGMHVSGFAGTSTERLAAGMGNEHLLENSLTFSHIHGLPYLPGSSLKGIARAWVVRELLCPHGNGSVNLNTLDLLLDAEDLEAMLAEQDGAVKLRDNFAFDESTARHLMTVKYELGQARQVFGSLSCKGAVVFFDAFPRSAVMETDVMTPHYRSYYGGNNWPKDDDNPNPILFAVVKDQANFAFRLAGCKPILVQAAEQWLQNALRDTGIGAKTAVGYGRFDKNTFTALDGSTGAHRQLDRADYGIALPDAETLKQALGSPNIEQAWPLIEQYVVELRDDYAESERSTLDEAVLKRGSSLAAEEISAARLRFMVLRLLPLCTTRAEKEQFATKVTGKKLHQIDQLKFTLPNLVEHISQDKFKARVAEWQAALDNKADAARKQQISKEAEMFAKYNDRLTGNLRRAMWNIVNTCNGANRKTTGSKKQSGPRR